MGGFPLPAPVQAPKLVPDPDQEWKVPKVTPAFTPKPASSKRGTVGDPQKVDVLKSALDNKAGELASVTILGYCGTCFMLER